MPKLLLSIACLALLALSACEPVRYASFGEEIAPEDAVSVRTVLENPAAYDGQSVKLKGTVREVCQNKGCWMALDGGNGQQVRITFRDYGFFVPKDISGRRVVLAGTVKHETVSVDDLRHFAQDAGQSPAEIDAITEPSVQLSVIADGVLVEEL